MKALFQKMYIRRILFVLAGALLGFLYYRTIGCLTGTCPIQSNPLKMTLFGSVIGFLVSHIIW